MGFPLLFFIFQPILMWFLAKRSSLWVIDGPLKHLTISFPTGKKFRNFTFSIMYIIFFNFLFNFNVFFL